MSVIVIIFSPLSLVNLSMKKKTEGHIFKVPAIKLSCDGLLLRNILQYELKISQLDKLNPLVSFG